MSLLVRWWTAKAIFDLYAMHDELHSAVVINVEVTKVQLEVMNVSMRVHLLCFNNVVDVVAMRMNR